MRPFTHYSLLFLSFLLVDVQCQSIYTFSSLLSTLQLGSSLLSGFMPSEEVLAEHKPTEPSPPQGLSNDRSAPCPQLCLHSSNCCRGEICDGKAACFYFFSTLSFRLLKRKVTNLNRMLLFLREQEREKRGRKLTTIRNLGNLDDNLKVR